MVYGRGPFLVSANILLPFPFQLASKICSPSLSAAARFTVSMVTLMLLCPI